jgi:hypothetical protein
VPVLNETASRSVSSLVLLRAELGLLGAWCSLTARALEISLADVLLVFRVMVVAYFAVEAVL